MKPLTAVPFALLSLIVAGLLTPTAAATTTKIPAASTETCAPTGPPAAQWQSGEVMHIRGLVELCQVVGTLNGEYNTGTNTVTVNLNLNLRTGEQEFWGTFYQVLTGTFAGSGWTGTWTTDRFIGRGFGELDGWTDHGQFLPGFTGTVGYVMSPGDS